MPKTSNGKGLLVDTLYYRFKGIEDDAGRLSLDDESVGEQPGLVSEKTVPIQMRMLKEFDGAERGSKRPVTGLLFTLSCENPKFEVRGTDIAALRAAVWDYLDKEFAVKWERYYLVRIEPAAAYSGAGTGLTFNYSDVMRGTAHDGTLLLKQYRFNGKPEILPWPGEFKDQRGKLMACIPATDENTRALEEFSSMVVEMRKRLAKFFTPEVIAKTLANLSGIRLLESD